MMAASSAVSERTRSASTLPNPPPHRPLSGKQAGGKHALELREDGERTVWAEEHVEGDRAKPRGIQRWSAHRRRESAAFEIVRVAAHHNEAGDSDDGERDGLLGPHGGRQTEKMAAKHRGRERLVIRERTKQEIKCSAKALGANHVLVHQEYSNLHVDCQGAEQQPRCQKEWQPNLERAPVWCRHRCRRVSRQEKA